MSKLLKIEYTENSVSVSEPPMPESEVARLIIAQQINTLEVDDNTAIRMTEFYP